MLRVTWARGVVVLACLAPAALALLAPRAKALEGGPPVVARGGGAHAWSVAATVTPGGVCTTIGVGGGPAGTVAGGQAQSCGWRRVAGGWGGDGGGASLGKGRWVFAAPVPADAASVRVLAAGRELARQATFARDGLPGRLYAVEGAAPDGPVTVVLLDARGAPLPLT